MKSRKAIVSLCLLFVLVFLLTGSDPGLSEKTGYIPAARFTGYTVKPGVPPGWVLDRTAGSPSLSLMQDGDAVYLHLISEGHSSFGIKKECRVDIRQYPYLTWRWKANRLPKGGDVRQGSRDDQALQLYIAFQPLGFPAKLKTPVIGYIWDNEAPKGWMGKSPKIGADKLRYVVSRNRTDRLDTWYTEKRNIYEDYRRLFKDVNGGEPKGLTSGIALYIDSQDTKSHAEGQIGEVYFSKR
ncbi:MAG: hypothetical protein A4E72_01457 [Syntrophus sp. PtaU1.Bin208]|nr:MAG: hypothetical protein A4E72_01457 [Syntrophus sp. PtaU1.Bin208]